MSFAVAFTSYFTTCFTRPLHSVLRMQQPWHRGVRLASGVWLSLQTWMCRSKTQEVQHQNTAPSSSVASGTDHYVCLKAIPNHLLAEGPECLALYDAWCPEIRCCFWASQPLKNPGVEITAIHSASVLCAQFLLPPLLWATANTVHFPPCLPMHLLRTQPDASLKTAPACSPVLPFPAPSLCQLISEG